MSSVSIILLSVLLAALVYRLFGNLRSWRSLPGPLPPGPRPWPVLGNLLQLGPRPHQAMAALARKHSPLLYLRFGVVDVVVIASASVAAKMLRTHDTNFLSRPPNAGAELVAYNYHDLAFAPYGPRWRLLWKIATIHLFSGKALEDYRHVRQEEAAVLIRGLAGAGSTAVGLGQLLNLCITNALGRVMLGYRVFGDGSGKSDPKADDFKSMVVEAMTISGVFNIGDFVPALQWLDFGGVRARMKKVHKRFDAFLTAVVEEHKAKLADVGDGQHTHDLLSTLLSLKEDAVGEDGKLTDTEIKAVLLNMFVAGTDTSASTVEWAIAELIRQPNILAQVQEELDRVVGQDRLVSELDIPNLTYLQAVVKEVFRLHPSTPLSLPRMAAENCEINGYHILKGTTVLTNVWAIARDPAEWTDPLEFKPERFLTGGEKAHVDIKGKDFEVIPFGAGRRICAGMSMGVRVVQLLTGSLAHAFNWDLPNGQVPEQLNMDEAFGLTLQRAESLIVHPQPRLAEHVYRA